MKQGRLQIPLASRFLWWSTFIMRIACPAMFIVTCYWAADAVARSIYWGIPLFLISAGMQGEIGMGQWTRYRLFFPGWTKRGAMDLRREIKP